MDLTFTSKTQLWIRSQISTERAVAASLVAMETGAISADDSTHNAVAALCSATAGMNGDAMLERLSSELSNELGLGHYLDPAVDQQRPAHGSCDHDNADKIWTFHGAVNPDVVQHWLAFDELHTALQEDLVSLPDISDLDSANMIRNEVSQENSQAAKYAHPPEIVIDQDSSVLSQPCL